MNEQEQISLEESIKAAEHILSFIPDDTNKTFLALYILEVSSIKHKAPFYAALANCFSRRLDEERQDKKSGDSYSAVSEILIGMSRYCKTQSNYFDKPDSS